MLLDLAVAAILCLSPLLQGSWDLWAQTCVRLAALGLAAAWLCWRVFTGVLPLPDRRTLLWAAAAAALTAAAALASPLHALSWPEAFNFLAAIGLVCAAQAMTQQGRESVEFSLRLTLWLLWALAFYQRFFLHELPPSSALINPNVFAGYLLMGIALAWRWHDWALVTAGLWALTWTHSLGAWICLSAAMVMLGWRRSPPFFWTGIALSLFAGIALYGKLQDPDSAHRLVWWGAALRMIAQRPWLGWGPGTFAYLLPSFRPDAVGGLGSLYAHQSWLELAVGWGVPAAALFTAVVVSALWSGRGVVRLGLLAACLHSFGDYALLIPANLWLFAYLLGTLLTGEPQRVLIRSSKKPLAILLVCGAAGAAGWGMFSVWQADRLTAQAQERATEGGPLPLELLDRARASAPYWPNPFLLEAQLARRIDPRAALTLQERAAFLNPYRPATWRDLAHMRAAAGDAAGAEAAMEEGRRYVPWLK